MKPLIVLLISFLIVIVVFILMRREVDFALSARIALAAMLVFTAVGHFVYNQGMTLMLPQFVPYKKELVYFTGVIEVIAAVGLLIHNVRVLTAWSLILFFIMLLPANIYAAAKHIDYQKATYDGNGFAYLWFRVPLQILFIVWTYISAIRF